MKQSYVPLPKSFYAQPTLQLAKNLLGCIIVKETVEGIASGMIVETEAYLGEVDRAAHSYGNRRTKRTEIMFQEAGYVYTYTMHTHTLVNVVCESVGRPEAVLIRAVEPVEGLELMRERRNNRPQKEWTNGPGKLTKALGINMADYGHYFTDKPLYLAEPPCSVVEILQGVRIGIDGSGEAKDYPYRFWIKDNPYVSR